MTLELSSLNDSQRSAVMWDKGPLLVLAGPGSGKTKVLTYRIARIIDSTPSKSFKVLGLTFTNKAAREMRERIESLIPNSSVRTLLTTFHSFCADVLRQHGSHIGLRPNFGILTQDLERAQLLDEAIASTHSPGEAPFVGEKLLPFIDRLLEFCILPEDVEAMLNAEAIPNAATLAKIYRSFRHKMLAENVLDFGGLIAECVRLFQLRPAISRQIRRIYTHVCVDEFQDTNLAQYKILRELVPVDNQTLFVVGDSDQIIYQWNGASPERLNQLRRDYSCQEIHLPENYRCPSAVIQVANKLISHNEGRTSALQLATKGPSMTSDVLRVRRFATLDSEMDWIAQDIASRSPSDRLRCAVLARTRKPLELSIAILAKYGLRSYLPSRKNEFNSAPLVWLHSVLRLANSRQDKELLRRICKSFFSIEGVEVNPQEVVSRSATLEGDLMRAWLGVVETRLPALSGICQHVLDHEFRRLMDYLSFRGLIKASFQWFDEAVSAGVQMRAERPFDEYVQERMVFESLLAEILTKYGEQVSLNALLQDFDLSSKAPLPPKDAVPLYTIHASKGLEFGHVYLMAMVEEHLPAWAAVKKGEGSREMQEERRNCFVAITRSQDSLTLTYSARMYGYGKAPSRFLQEMNLLEKP